MVIWFQGLLNCVTYEQPNVGIYLIFAEKGIFSFTTSGSDRTVNSQMSEYIVD